MKRLLLPLSLLLLASACSSLTDARAPGITAVELAEAGPLARALRVALDRPDTLTVEYWTDDGPRLRIRAPRDAAHDLLLARLRPGREYRWRIVGTEHAGAFTTPVLPPDLAAITLTPTGRPTPPLVLLHLYHPTGFRGYAVVDRDGEVVWYHRTVDFPFGATRRPNGDFVFLDKAAGLVEVTPAGAVVASLPQDTAGRGEMHHDVIAGPGNTLLVIAFDARDTPAGRVKGEAIWEWSPERGTAVKRWSAWDHFSPATDRGPRFGGEWMHGNSLAIGPRGNVLLSVHYWNQVVSLTPDLGAVEWRLGGVNATLPVPAEEQFSGQHTAREIAPGRVLLFDNRLERGGYSRAVELDVSGPVARRVGEWRPARPNFATAVGSARRLPSGNTLVTFGMSTALAGSTGPTEVYELAPGGEEVWHLEVGGVTVMFRAEPLESIAGEEER